MGILVKVILRKMLNAQFSESEQKKLDIQFLPFEFKGKLPGHYVYENKVYSKRIFDHYKDQLDNFDFVYSQGFTGWAFFKSIYET